MDAVVGYAVGSRPLAGRHLKRMLIGLSRAERPPDTQQPFGHGKEIYFWSFNVAMMVFALGAGVATYEGIVKLLDPHPLQNVEVLYVVLAVAFVLEGYSMVRAVRDRRRDKMGLGFFRALRASKDPAVLSVVLEDIAAVAGLLIALCGHHGCGSRRLRQR